MASRFPTVEEHSLQRNSLIAVVDDDAGMCEAIAELLEVLGFETAQFSSAESFLASSAADAFDCLVSDIRMPGMDGFELGRRIAMLAPELPVIFVSSIDDEHARSMALRVGGVAFLRKPLDPDEFQRKIELALGRAGGAS
jgi:FixJ family two-component response regulator